ncbi:hypothetical protein [Bacilliculturomica massiliensis]|uniref:hypothetical protein n=1 Tax=Bacilliculturomica massiliensis TaxID=1917867 RepID=UPI001030D424|nr:hypothetical protein [Bacilliculturomica massiliensis]
MAKTIKFNLICDEKPVRTIEDLQNNFSIEDVIAYYQNGLLHRWLAVRGYGEELEKVSAIAQVDAMDIIKELIKIFDVVTDEKDVNKSIYILEYLRERQERYDCYEEKRRKVQSIINDHMNRYQYIVNEIIENKYDSSKIKAAINEIVKTYPRVLRLNYRNLFYTFKSNNCILAIMCLLMNEKSREYYLPIQETGEDGEVTEDIEHDEDKRVMYRNICMMISDEETLKNDLEDDLCTFSGHTDGYWKDLEPKGKKYMIISMDYGDYVRSAGLQGGDMDSSDINERFVILDGIDYKSNSIVNTLLYMEV